MVDQGSLYRNINILFYYHIRHSNIKKYNREIEMNISHAVQGDEMNISNPFHTHRSLFKKCNQFRTQTCFLIRFFYAGNAHVMKADSKTASLHIYFLLCFFLFFYSIRDCLFILIFDFKQSAYCTGNMTSIYYIMYECI